MDSVPFHKMHGLGNDFVVIDTRRNGLRLTAAQARAVADRRAGVGCDQLILLEPARNGGAAAFMRILNADGGESGACGNATRCVAALLMQEGLTREGSGGPVVIETRAGLLAAEGAAGGLIAVDMGEARLDWQDIPLRGPADTLHLDLALGPLRDPVAVSMGNPHAVFFVADAAAVDLGRLGPELEHHPLFPERANIGVAEVLSTARIRLRVWERGAGLTPACGTGACAALVAASRRGLAERRAEVLLPGGPLEIEWRADNHVTMTGPVAISFTGRLDESMLREAAP